MQAAHELGMKCIVVTGNKPVNMFNTCQHVQQSLLTLISTQAAHELGMTCIVVTGNKPVNMFNKARSLYIYTGSA